MLTLSLTWRSGIVQIQELVGQHSAALLQALDDAGLPELESLDDRGAVVSAVDNLLRKLESKFTSSTSRAQALYQQRASKEAELKAAEKSSSKVRMLAEPVVLPVSACGVWHALGWRNMPQLLPGRVWFFVFWVARSRLGPNVSCDPIHRRDNHLPRDIFAQAMACWLSAHWSIGKSSEYFVQVA